MMTNTQETEYALFALGCSTADDVISDLAMESRGSQLEAEYWRSAWERERGSSNVMGLALAACSGGVMGWLGHVVWTVMR